MFKISSYDECCYVIRDKPSAVFQCNVINNWKVAQQRLLLGPALIKLRVTFIASLLHSNLLHRMCRYREYSICRMILRILRLNMLARVECNNNTYVINVIIVRIIKRNSAWYLIFIIPEKKEYAFYKFYYTVLCYIIIILIFYSLPLIIDIQYTKIYRIKKSDDILILSYFILSDFSREIVEK